MIVEHNTLKILGWLMGIEPTTTGITIRDSTTELQPPFGNGNTSFRARAPVAEETAMACPTGIEPVTPSLEGWCSIRLSYGHNSFRGVTTFKPGRGGEIRTPDILLPKQARYQATL